MNKIEIITQKKTTDSLWREIRERIASNIDLKAVEGFNKTLIGSIKETDKFSDIQRAYNEFLTSLQRIDYFYETVSFHSRYSRIYVSFENDTLNFLSYVTGTNAFSQNVNATKFFSPTCNTTQTIEYFKELQDLFNSYFSALTSKFSLAFITGMLNLNAQPFTTNTHILSYYKDVLRSCFNTSGSHLNFCIHIQIPLKEFPKIVEGANAAKEKLLADCQLYLAMGRELETKLLTDKRIKETDKTVTQNKSKIALLEEIVNEKGKELLNLKIRLRDLYLINMRQIRDRDPKTVPNPYAPMGNLFSGYMFAEFIEKEFLKNIEQSKNEEFNPMGSDVSNLFRLGNSRIGSVTLFTEDLTKNVTPIPPVSGGLHDAYRAIINTTNEDFGVTSEENAANQLRVHMLTEEILRSELLSTDNDEEEQPATVTTSTVTNTAGVYTTGIRNNFFNIHNHPNFEDPSPRTIGNTEPSNE